MFVTLCLVMKAGWVLLCLLLYVLSHKQAGYYCVSLYSVTQAGLVLLCLLLYDLSHKQAGYYCVCYDMPCLSVSTHLVGLVVKASASGATDPGFESRLRRGDFFFSGRFIPGT